MSGDTDTALQLGEKGGIDTWPLHDAQLSKQEITRVCLEWSLVLAPPNGPIVSCFVTQRLLMGAKIVESQSGFRGGRLSPVIMMSGIHRSGARLTRLEPGILEASPIPNASLPCLMPV